MIESSERPILAWFYLIRLTATAHFTLAMERTRAIFSHRDRIEARNFCQDLAQDCSVAAKRPAQSITRDSRKFFVTPHMIRLQLRTSILYVPPAARTKTNEYGNNLQDVCLRMFFRRPWRLAPVYARYAHTACTPYACTPCAHTACTIISQANCHAASPRRNWTPRHSELRCNAGWM